MRYQASGATLNLSACWKTGAAFLTRGDVHGKSIGVAPSYTSNKEITC